MAVPHRGFVIERTLKLITVTIKTARPGIIIGKGGQEVDKLKEELKKIKQVLKSMISQLRNLYLEKEYFKPVENNIQEIYIKARLSEDEEDPETPASSRSRARAG